MSKRIGGAKRVLKRRVKPERIERLLKKWRRKLGLETWAIDVRYDEHEMLASCEACPQYETATLTFNMHRINKEVILEEELVVHELVHCMIWKSSERAVTQVARAILRAAGASGVE